MAYYYILTEDKNGYVQFVTVINSYEMSRKQLKDKLDELKNEYGNIVITKYVRGEFNTQ